MQRMQYARDSLKNIFPIDTKSFKELSPEQISRTDQLIYRFSQLQDTIGNKFRTPYLSQSKLAEILKTILKSVPGNMVSVWFKRSASSEAA